MTRPLPLFELLYQNALADNDLLHSNDEKHDVFTVARDVDFAFKSQARQNADDLCEYINGKNFGVARVEPAEGGELFWVFVVIHMPITQHVICSISGFMLCLSRLFLVDYDGWGSVIQSVQS